jgi:hypothetical protein
MLLTFVELVVGRLDIQSLQIILSMSVCAKVEANARAAVSKYT